MTKEKKPFNLRLALLLGTVIILLLIQISALLPGVTTPIENIDTYHDDAACLNGGYDDD